MTYKEYRDEREEQVKKLPIFFAFSDEQFEEELKKRGLTKDDKGLLLRLTNGIYCLRQDRKIVQDYFRVDHDAELRQMMEDNYNFARAAIAYEMANHEYPTNTQKDFDVCSCFGTIAYGKGKDGTDYLKELGFSDNIIRIYEDEARNICMEF